MERKRVCPGCGKEKPNVAVRFCQDCGNEFEEVPVNFISSTCKICDRPILVNPDSDMHLCTYHWEIYDANEGWN